MRMGAANEIGVGLVFEVDVVGIAALAGDKAVVFLALHSRADACLAHVIFLPFTCWTGARLHARGAVLNGLDDVVVAGAAADVAFELVANRGFVQGLALAIDE